MIPISFFLFLIRMLLFSYLSVLRPCVGFGSSFVLVVGLCCLHFSGAWAGLSKLICMSSEVFIYVMYVYDI